MKANQKLRTDTNAQSQMHAVVTIIALLIAIVIGVMVYYEVIDNVDQLTETTEYFTGYDLGTGQNGTHTGGSNASIQTITLSSSPYSTDNSTISVICFNDSATAILQCQQTSSPPVVINHRTVTIPAAPTHGNGTPLTYSRINVTYTSKTARAQGTDVTPMAQSIFTLLPIIALVIVAAIILAVVLGFGGGAGRKGGGI